MDLCHSDFFFRSSAAEAVTGITPVSYTHLDVYKRQEENQLACYLDDIEYMNHAIEKMIQKLKEITENESWKVTDCTE